MNVTGVKVEQDVEYATINSGGCIAAIQKGYKCDVSFSFYTNAELQSFLEWINSFNPDPLIRPQPIVTFSKNNVPDVKNENDNCVKLKLKNKNEKRTYDAIKDLEL